MPEQPSPPADHDFQALDRKLPFVSPEAIDVACLDAFDYAYPGCDIEIRTETEEFTSVCPFSGLPDFARVTIVYVPDKKCVELRSLKYYLMSYRNVGIFYEHLSNRIRDDLVALLAPRTMRIECAFTTRGGLRTTVVAEYPPTA